MERDDKKGVTLGPIRVDEQTAKDYANAANYYGLSRTVFARMCIDALIQCHQARREIELPVVFLLGPTRDARRAAEALGIDIARFREELAKDIIAIAARGDRIALPGHILTEREQKILSRSKPTTRPVWPSQ